MATTKAGQHWGVLGGGILGLTLARELARDGAKVTLCEASPQVGGLASAWQLGSVTWDRHYHVTLLSDSALRSLLAELGLEHELRWVRTRTGFYVDDKLFSLSNAQEFLRFPPLRLVDKLRLAATIFYASRIRDWESLEQVPVTDWLRRLSGGRTFEKIWQPLLKSKLGEAYQDVSAAFIWTTINRLYAARRSGMKEEMFGYIPGGYARVLERFAQELISQGVDVRCSTPCKQVRSLPSGIEVEYQDCTIERFDRVVLTMPSPVAASICQELNPEERARWNAIRYQGIVCASVMLSRPLGGYYVTNITDSSLPYTGVIEMSALVDPSFFGGNHLVYLPKYVASDDRWLQLPDAEIKDRFLNGLSRMYPDFEPSQVLAFEVSRARHVFALPTIGYSTRLPPVRTSMPGVYILNSAHIVNGTLNVNETIRLAQLHKAGLS